ncbi:hypothetical protein OIDMADRAFT_60751 [Oidiodendron maius Zn]|uniref:Uncharacterized protein n=1 Tax=Oidiodendron maius (strain Zn) TaxID=913774 RepID=A0A0C3GSW5_OIDMZ|nr:hypothetical protein OIDMADRAFT_60751 [Oidiodendron maius Zn]
MRLLELKDNGKFSLTSNIVIDIPPYAILSHTWGCDNDEVSFKNLIEGSGNTKAGYKKLQFCGEQAARDGLQHFWIDTCCVDKSDNTELSEAINSMFCWYHNAAKCYVYLSDVSGPMSNQDGKHGQLHWEPAFRESRWFTRGWTLQELVAPTSVEFFSTEGEQLGNKTSLERYIHEITGIPIKVLRGGALSNFGITERLSWAEKRETTRKEDTAYSLLGIFDVHMPLIYGEGRDSAFRRLREEIDKASKGIQYEDFSVPFGLSDASDIYHFVAREKELEEMHKELHGDGSRRTVVLHGLGGIGKTQLAIAYMKRYKNSYSAIFWLNIKDEDSLKQSFAKSAKQILQEHPLASRLSSVDVNGLNEVTDAVKAWLSLPNNIRWLMIYDNYDNPKFPGSTDSTAVNIRDFLPESYQGSVIITTRSSQVQIDRLIPVRKLENINDSIEILLHISRREGLRDNPDAIRLAEELDGLPLALATAGAYLYQVAISLPDYLRLYKVSWAELQKSSPRLTSYEDRTLYSTWQLSFDNVRQQNSLSAKLLRLWAYFDNQDLWFELLRHRSFKQPKWIRQLVKNELSFHSVMRVLCDHGLVEADISSQELIESRGYSIHGCVHSWTIHILNQEWNFEFAKVAVKLVGAHVPEQEAVRPWLTQRRLLQHAARCSYIVFNDLVTDDDMDWAYHNLGLLYRDQGKLAEAEEMYKRALQGREKAFGPEHILTLDTVNCLGILYLDQDKLADAEEMLLRALEGNEKTLGTEHWSTLITVHCFGRLYNDQGKLTKAEEMYQRALQGREKVLGPKNISTLTTVNNLGTLYAHQGKLAKAEEMYQRALQGFETALGPEHKWTLTAVDCLGSLYIDQGKLTEAEEILQRALQGNEKTLGPEHTSTLNTVHNLGNLFVDQGKLTKAEEMLQRALQEREKTLGSERKSTLDTVNSLGFLYKDQGKLAKAEEMYRRVLQGREKALGPEHISTLNAVSNLGVFYRHQGKLAKAEEMYQQVLQGREKTLGSEHTSTLNTVHNLGTLYVEQGKLTKAEGMLQQALQGREKNLGSEHISTLNTVNSLGFLYKHQGKPTEAKEMYKRALQGYEKALGLEHRLTINTVNNLGFL